MAPSVNYKIWEPVSKCVSLFEQYLQQFTTPVFTLSGTNEQIAKQIQEFANKVRIGAWRRRASSLAWRMLANLDTG